MNPATSNTPSGTPTPAPIVMALLEDGCWEALGWGEVREALGCDVTDPVTDTVEELEAEETLGRNEPDTVEEPEVVVEDDGSGLFETPATFQEFPNPPENVSPPQHPLRLASLPSYEPQQNVGVYVPFVTGQG